MSLRVTTTPGVVADLTPEATPVAPAAGPAGSRRTTADAVPLRAGRRSWRFTPGGTDAGAPSDDVDGVPEPGLLQRAPRRPRRRGARGSDVPGAEAEYELADERQVRARAGRSQATLTVAVGGMAGGHGSDGGSGNNGSRQRQIYQDTPVASSRACISDASQGTPAEVARRVEHVIDAFGHDLQRHTHDPDAARAALAQAVFALSRIERDHTGITPLRLTAWRLMANYLAAPSRPDATPESVGAVRERLAALFVDGAKDSPDALRRFQLLLPLWLLNAARPRRARDGRRTVARLRMMLADGGSR